MLSRDPSVVVVGAGAGGLASAIDLAARGFRVTLVERTAAPGGKIRAEQVAGRAVDAGPTVLTMRWVLDDLFESAGARVDDALVLEPANVLARHAWSDGTRLDLFADPARSEEAVGAAFGLREARAYREFMLHARRIYETVEYPFLRAQRPTIRRVAREHGLRGLVSFARVDAFRTMWTALAATFADDRLRQLFGRYATYCGSSPYEAPATLNLIAHVEGAGVHRVRGGMRAVASALEDLAKKVGVALRCGSGVRSLLVDAGRAAGVELECGERIASDAVVFAGDANAVASGLLGAPVARAVSAMPREGRSLSAVTWALVGRAEGFPLVHHNVFFSEDYGAEFDDIARGRAPEAPTVYVCAQDRGDAPDELSEERMLLIVNAPATGDDPAAWSEPERQRCDRAAFRTLRACGLSLRPTAWVRTTPVEFAERFPATGGALYGPASRGSTSALARPGASTMVPGLYLAGGSVHPGAGVPMAISSGRRAAEQLRADLASIGRSRRAATSGTTSMG